MNVGKRDANLPRLVGHEVTKPKLFERANLSAYFSTITLADRRRSKTSLRMVPFFMHMIRKWSSSPTQTMNSYKCTEKGVSKVRRRIGHEFTYLVCGNVATTTIWPVGGNTSRVEVLVISHVLEHDVVLYQLLVLFIRDLVRRSRGERVIISSKALVSH